MKNSKNSFKILPLNNNILTFCYFYLANEVIVMTDSGKDGNQIFILLTSQRIFKYFF